MLRLNFERIFKARGIERPFSYLLKAGFSDNFATKIKKGYAQTIRSHELEKLCLLLRCSPNDLYEWIPDNDTEVDAKHPMNKIRQTNKMIDITKALHSVPLDRLEEIEKYIKGQVEQ
ncbi:XRE family transcriptional regulator [Marinilabiliaceae bacterium JC017]|nr:XRE family transcriptional regulator [Marinilabiliaceae bacterium JC017]